MEVQGSGLEKEVPTKNGDELVSEEKKEDAVVKEGDSKGTEESLEDLGYEVVRRETLRMKTLHTFTTVAMDLCKSLHRQALHQKVSTPR